MIEVDGRKCYLTEAAEHLTNYWVGGVTLLRPFVSLYFHRMSASHPLSVISEEQTDSMYC